AGQSRVETPDAADEARRLLLDLPTGELVHVDAVLLRGADVEVAAYATQRLVAEFVHPHHDRVSPGDDLVGVGIFGWLHHDYPCSLVGVHARFGESFISVVCDLPGCW